ncbi:hypothetical protein KY285_004352 [Solanum tuberosum]|nr:hypothetical protein KY285_004352 [Solanum tuberosum]
MQLMQVMKVTNLIKGERQSITINGKEKIIEGKEKEDLESLWEEKDLLLSLWEEKDVLLRTWISGTMTEENMYLIVGCSTAQEMWECLEETYLQATKNKEFQLKQQLQNIKLGAKKLDEYLKEFKGICDGLAAIQKPLDEDSKGINFARGVDLKYKTFRTVMLGKTPYPTLNQFANALRGFDMRENDEEVPLENHNMAFYAQRGRGRGRGGYNHNQNRGNSNYNSRGRGFKPAGQGNYSQNNQNIQASNHVKDKDLASNACQICGRNNHTAIKCFYRWDYSYQAVEDLPQALATVNFQDTQTEDNAIKLAKDNCCTLEFDESDFVVKDKKSGKQLAKGTKKGGLYALEDNNIYALIATLDRRKTNCIWHARLGHPSLKSLLF